MHSIFNLKHHFFKHSLFKHNFYQSGRLFTLATLCSCLVACSPNNSSTNTPNNTSPHFNAVDITGVEYKTAFSLTDHTGQIRTLADFKGKVVVLFFGYTQCPDVCPTTLNELATVMQSLGNQSDQVQVLFVTLDPERDTQIVLQQYVPKFDKRFLGLRGTPTEITQMTTNYKAFFQQVKGSTPTSYTIDHTAASYVFDQSGALRLFIRNGSGTQAILQDLQRLLAR